MGTDVLTRRENKTTLKKRKIFLNELTLKQVKKQEFHSRMNVTQLHKQNGQQKYKDRTVIQDKKEQEKIIRECHDDKIARHPDVRETLRKIKEVVFWDSIIKDTIKHVRECLPCQKKRPNRQLGIGQEINRPKKNLKENIN